VAFSGREVCSPAGDYNLGLADADPADPTTLLPLQDFYAEMAQASGTASDAARLLSGKFEGDKTIYKVIPPRG